MTRLFLRFYVGVLVILLAAWFVQSWLYGNRFNPQNAQVVRDAYFGGMRLARAKFLEDVATQGPSAALEEIRRQYDFPVRRHTIDKHWDFGELHLCRGIDHDLGAGTFVLSRLREGEEPVLAFGPLPEFIGPTNFEVGLGMGVVLLSSALAIALLLRPVVKQFQAVEKVAAQIAAGDLSARIEDRRGVASTGLIRSFNEMAARAEGMVRSQRELLQAVSHELRTPLARIQFATEMIRTGDADVREERLQSLEGAADDLDELVGELLTYVRMGAHPESSRENVDAGGVVRQIVENHALLFANIHFDLDEALRSSTVFASADPNGFQRAMKNLISNAARFSQRTVKVSTWQAGNRLIIDVDDDGPGIPGEDRDRVFEPFVRLGDSGTGVGLGLAIVKRILDQHGGTISAEDCPLGGCRMRTVWPLATPQAQDRADAAVATESVTV